MKAYFAKAGIVAAAMVGLVGDLGIGASVSGLAHAQVEALDTGYNVERFRLASDSGGVLDAESADVPGHLHLEVGMWIGYADDPLNLYRDAAIERERAGSLVSHRLGGDLALALALVDRLQLSLHVPLVLSQDQTLEDLMGPSSISSFGLGDLKPAAKIQLAFAERHHVDFAVRLAVSLPSAGDRDYFGDTGATFSPELLLSAPLSENLRLVANLGLRMREQVEVLDLVVDDEIFAHVGAGYRVHERVELDATVSVATPPVDLFGAFNRNYSEVRGGATVDLGIASVFAALGAGTSEGFGTPDWRLIAGARFATSFSKSAPRTAATVLARADDSTDSGMVDSDGDGLVDADDQCPLVAEDYDGEDDDDGCPEGAPVMVTSPKTGEPTVADGAGSADEKEPTEQAADKPGPAVAIADRDGDGVADGVDNCPDIAGTEAFFGCTEEQLVRLTGDGLYVLERVHFETDASAIRPQSYRLLRNVASVLKVHPELNAVSVEGHTDDRGSASYNEGLSSRRAKAVRNFLIAAGISAGRLTAVGRGESKPVADNATEEGQATNRRVEFVLLDQ